MPTKETIRLEDLTLDVLIQQGKRFAVTNTEEAWQIIDDVYIPAIQRKAVVVHTSLIEEAYEILGDYLCSNESAIRDYTATVAGAIFTTFPKMQSLNSRLIRNLKRVATEDAEVFPRFRATIALVEAEQRSGRELELDYGKLLLNLEEGIEADNKLSSVAEPISFYLLAKISKEE